MKTIVFVVGAGHSGSTILSKALNAHSRIFALSEIAQFYDEMQNENTHCGCGVLLKQCPFWEDVNQNLRTQIEYGIKDRPNQFRISRDTGKNSIIHKIQFKLARIAATCFFCKTAHVKHRLENIRLLFETVIEKTGNDVLVDSSKSAKRAFLVGNYLSKHGYDIKVIHLFRDGRGVLYSYLKGYYKVKLKDPDTGKFETHTFYSNIKRKKEDVVKLWKTDNYESVIFHKTFNRKGYFALCYENFANYPEETLRRLLAFIGLGYEPEMLDLNKYENHMVSGNASRINADKILPPFNSWKKKLSKEELDYFEKKGGRLNQKLGYH